jgi:predicted permease
MRYDSNKERYGLKNLGLEAELHPTRVMPIVRDLQFGCRVLRHNPGFTLVAVLTLALGIAVNTTVFSWIDSVLLHPFPGTGNPRELALVETVTPAGEYLINTSYLDYRDYRDNLKLVSGLAIARFTPLSVGADGRTGRAWAELVSANYFDVLQVKPALGRGFLPSEAGDQPGAYPVAVISHNFWRTHFQADPRVLGKRIRLNRQELTIVGVASPEFRGTMSGVVFDVWMPITMARAMGTGGGTLRNRATRDITSTIARLRPGVTLEQARAEVSAFAKRLAQTYPDTNRGVDATLSPLWRAHSGAQRLLLTPLRILMAFSLLLLLIVCANVANLLLARAVSRQREFSVRRALGAGRLQLMRQLFVETMLLAGAGGLAGVLLAMWLGQSLAYLLPPFDINVDLGGGMNLPTLWFTLAIAVVATLISGTVPAVLSARVDVNDALKQGGRSGGSGRHSHRLRGLLVVAEVALSMVALVGAGLFYRSFRNAAAISPGFNMSHASVSMFYLSNAGYTAREQHDFCRALRRRLEASPGVTAVTYADSVPLTMSTPWHQIDIPGYSPARDEQMMIHRTTVPPGYFDFMGIPLLAGRDFTELDEAQQPFVMIVNETFARRYFGGGIPIGRKVNMERRVFTIVGVVKDVKYHSVIEAPMPFFYVPFRQWFEPGLNFNVFVRTAGDPMKLTATLRREALALNQDAVFNAQLFSDAATTSLYPLKVAASLLSVVGIVCLLLASVGLYSVMSYAVSQRRQELGIRMAMGARPGNVLGLVLREGLRLTLPGLLAGMLLAALGTRAAGGMLVEVSGTDPATFAGAAAFLGVVALLASLVPAWRATKVDPMTALRSE